MALPKGTYWILGQYTGGPSICADATTSNKLIYIYYPSPTTAFPYLPETITSQMAYPTGADINFFVRGS
jgi:hypothetical protein